MIDDALAALTPERTRGYGPGPIPGEVDDDVRRLLAAVRGADADARGAIGRRLGDRVGMILLLFAERMAALAVRTGDPGPAREGLDAATLGARAVDRRDGLVRLSLLDDALRRLGLDPSPFFAAAEDLAAPDFREGLLGFPARPPESRSIAAMKYEAGADADGFRYLCRW